MFQRHTSAHFSGGQFDTLKLSFLERISINQLTTLRSTLEEDLLAYRKANVPGIGLSRRKLYDYAPNLLVKLVRDSCLKVTSLGWVGSFLGFNGHRREEAICEAKDAIRLAARVHAPVVTVLSGPQAGHIGSHACRLLIDSLERLLPLAERSRVSLALMPMHPKFARDWSFLTHLKQTRDLIEKINHPRLGLCFSTYHSCHEAELLTQMTDLIRHIKLVQVADWAKETRCDNSRAMPGDGILRLPEMIQTLEANGYTGWYELDVWSRHNWQQNPDELLRVGLEAMQSLTTATDLTSLA